MAQPVEFEPRGAAQQAGVEVPIASGGAFSAIVSAADVEGAAVVVLQNNSDTDIVVRPEAADDAADDAPGLVLKANGGAWVDDRYLGAWSGRQDGGTDKNLTVVVF